MCSNYEEGDTAPLKADKSNLSNLKECMKCKKKQAQVVIRVNDAFCRDCFLGYCTHKFRSAFGKSKIIRDGERVLVAFSGGQASAAMLHLVKEGKSVRAQKKLRFLPGLIYVDDGLAYGHSESQRSLVCEKISGTFSGSEYFYHIVKLEQLFDGDDNGEKSSAEKLTEFFNQINSVTAKEQLIKTLRKELITRVAKTEGYSKVIVGETSTRLSAAILSSMAQGKGAHIAYDTSLLDDRDPEIYYVRPMKDFTAKEISLYNMFFNLQSQAIPTFTTKAGTGASIDKLTEAFVNGLQADFPSTVSTIMRTGEKLKNTKSNTAGSDSTVKKCIVCKAPLDTFVPESSALGSLRYSDILGQQRKAALRSDGSDVLTARNQVLPSGSLSDESCYSCQQMLQDTTDDGVLRSVCMNRSTMLEMIKDNIIGE